MTCTSVLLHRCHSPALSVCAAAAVALCPQADILQVRVLRPHFPETTCLGAALAAGLGVGFWSEEQVRGRLVEGRECVTELGRGAGVCCVGSALGGNHSTTYTITPHSTRSC